MKRRILSLGLLSLAAFMFWYFAVREEPRVIELLPGVKLYRLPFPIGGLDWSPDGRQLAVASVLVNHVEGSFPLPALGQPPPSEIYVWTPATNELVQISDQVYSEDNAFPRWHPTAAVVGYISADEFGDERSLAAVNLDNGDVIPLSLRGRGNRFDWLPDGSGIVFASFDVYKAINGGLDTDLVWSGSHQDVRNLSVSPDGDRLAIVAENFSRQGSRSVVVLVDIDTADEFALLDHVFVRALDWHPGGQWITAAGLEWGLRNVAVDGQCFSTVFPLPPEYDRVVDLSWSPDGRRLALAVTLARGAGAIILIDANSQALTDWWASADC